VIAFVVCVLKVRVSMFEALSYIFVLLNEEQVSFPEKPIKTTLKHRVISIACLCRTVPFLQRRDNV